MDFRRSFDAVGEACPAADGPRSLDHRATADAVKYSGLMNPEHQVENDVFLVCKSHCEYRDV